MCDVMVFGFAASFKSWVRWSEFVGVGMLEWVCWSEFVGVGSLEWVC